MDIPINSNRYTPHVPHCTNIEQKHRPNQFICSVLNSTIYLDISIMKRPLCRLISVALILLCSIETSNANRALGVHTGTHWSSSTTYETTDAALGVEAKSTKPKKHAGNGGKHDSGVDGKHPDKTNSSKTAKTTPSTPASDSWGSPALSHHTKTEKVPPAVSMSYAKTHKDSTPSDSKADKGEDSKSYKPAPNEYNGVKMVVKTPEGGYKQTKAAKDTDTSAGNETGESSGKPMMDSKSGKPSTGESDGSSGKPMKDSKSGKPGTGDSDESSSSGTSVTTISGPGTIVSGPDTEVLPDTVETTTTTTTTVATEPATEAAATTPQAVQRAPEVPQKRIEDSSPDEPDEQESPTYSPTFMHVEQTSSVEETFTAMDPFGLRFLTSKQQPSFNLDTVTTVTTEHLLHSFRTKGWDADRLELMLLDDEDRRRGLRKLDSFPVHELVFGGILYFKATTEMPTKEEENALVEESFSGSRMRYFVNLLKEEGVDVYSASWGHLATSSESTGESGNNKLAIILGSVFGSIALVIAVALLVRVYNKRARRVQHGDRPSNLVFRIKEEVESMMDSHDDPASTLPSSIEANEAASRYSYYSKQRLMVDPISPLDIPDDTHSTSTRYVSVFTVKKDCGGKTLDQVDLRSLAVAYLSRLFKKVPDTSLLPYDKESQLPAIHSIRNIPDDMQELLEYVGNPRIDENTGKVMFNLRCESDVPMSKMKNLSSNKQPKQESRSTANEDRSAASGFEDVSL